MKKEYSVSPEAKKLNRQKLFVRITKVVFLFLLFLISVVYFILYVLYQDGSFTVTLDGNADNRKNVFLSETGDLTDMSIKLSAKSLDYIDNISVNWIKEDVDTEADGSHNGDNYLAYSFYVINYGNETVNYWYQVNLLDIVKNVDEAVRIRLYLNGHETTYAKLNQTTNTPESGTTAFYSESIPVLEVRENFKPGEKDCFTIVVWLEGDDPDCIDDIIGGELKMEMNITEEHLNQEN